MFFFLYIYFCVVRFFPVFPLSSRRRGGCCQTTISGVPSLSPSLHNTTIVCPHPIFYRHNLPQPPKRPIFLFYPDDELNKTWKLKKYHRSWFFFDCFLDSFAGVILRAHRWIRGRFCDREMARKTEAWKGGGPTLSRWSEMTTLLRRRWRSSRADYRDKIKIKKLYT